MKDDIVRVARIEPAGYPDREILVIVETEAAPLQIRMPESALVKVRQFDRHQFVVYFFRLVLLQQVQVQRCGNGSSRFAIRSSVDFPAPEKDRKSVV